MMAVMLAAGVGSRLFGAGHERPPKVLLQFDGKTLLQRHVENLLAAGIERLAVVVGYRKDDVIDALAATAPSGFASWIENPAFREGSVLSMCSARDEFASGESVLFMDADVLYHPEVLFRLVRAEGENCFLFDRHLNAGEDPVRLCVRGGEPVDIGKGIAGACELVGEWPGFLKLGPQIGRQIARLAQEFEKGERRDAPYEDVLRDALHQAAPGTFTCEDISGIPWIEIDFPEDLERAQGEILPRIRAHRGQTR
jgi:choline kinase